MQNVLLRDCWWEGVARAKRPRSRLFLEEVRLVEHDIPLHAGPPETAEDNLFSGLREGPGQSSHKEQEQKNDGYSMLSTTTAKGYLFL
jgi:hypothetical protein